MDLKMATKIVGLQPVLHLLEFNIMNHDIGSTIITLN